MYKVVGIALALGGLVCFISCTTGAPLTPPRYDHVVIAIEENKDASEVRGFTYISSLAVWGTSFTQMYALVHPSQPNYLALFSGSMQGVTDDGTYDLTAPNLYTSLLAKGLTYASYSEGLPYDGCPDATYGRYARKHNPAASFKNVPDQDIKMFSEYPTAYADLPTVSYVIPDLDNDMHDGTIATGDTWLKNNLDGYVQWARTHNSLFILTFDEPDAASAVDTTPIATIFVGQHVRQGASATHVTLYSVLKMLDEMYGLPYLGEDATAPEIPSGIWN